MFKNAKLKEIVYTVKLYYFIDQNKQVDHCTDPLFVKNK